MRKLIACLLAATLVGCTTTLKLQPLPADGPYVGAPYSLLFTQYDVTVERRLIGCAPLKIKVDVSATASIVNDPAAEFLVDPASMASWVKTSEVKFEYDDQGRLEALNAGAEDRTVETVAAAAGAVSQFVGLAALDRANDRGFDAGPSGKCQTLVKAVATARSKTGTLAKAVDAQRLDYLRAAARAASGEGSRKEERAARKKLLVSTEMLRQAQSELAEALDDVTDVTVRKWPENGDAFSGEIGLDADVFNAWTGGGVDLETAKVKLQLMGVDPADGSATALSPARKADVANGLPYRTPGPGRLVATAGGETVLDARGRIMQAGRLYYLEAKSRPFQSVNVTLNLHENGQPKLVGFSQKSAPGEGFATAAKSVLEEAKTSADTLQTARTKALQREVDELNAEQAKREAVEKNALQDEVALKTSEIALIKADGTLNDPAP